MHTYDYPTWFDDVSGQIPAPTYSYAACNAGIPDEVRPTYSFGGVPARARYGMLGVQDYCDPGLDFDPSTPHLGFAPKLYDFDIVGYNSHSDLARCGVCTDDFFAGFG